MSDATGELADGFEFLCLLQLALEGAEFGDVLDHAFERVGRTRQGKIAKMETNGEKASVLAAPLGFGAVNEALFAASSRKLDEIFGIAEDVRGKAEAAELLEGGAGQEFEKRSVRGNKGTIDRNAKDAVGGMLHEFTRARFGFGESETKLRVGLAQPLILKAAFEGDGKPSETIFQDVIIDAMFKRIRGGILVEEAGNEKERNLTAGSAQGLQGLQAGPSGDLVCGEDGVEAVGSESGFKFDARGGDGGIDGVARVAEFVKDEVGIRRQGSRIRRWRVVAMTTDSNFSSVKVFMETIFLLRSECWRTAARQRGKMTAT